MRKISNIILVIATLLCYFSAKAADEDVRFVLLPTTGEDLPASVVDALDTKLRQALNRTSALTEDEYWPYAIRPTLLIGEEASTSGMVRDITRIACELSLQAVSTINGTVYYAVTIPMSATVTGSREEALRKMAVSLKATDPAFVRFVRKARQKIDESMVVIVVPEDTDSISGGSDSPVVDGVPATRVDPTPAASEGIDDTIVIGTPRYPEETPVPNQPAEPANDLDNVRIKLSHHDSFSFRILECTGYRSSEKVKIVAQVINTGMHTDEPIVYLRKAISNTGQDWDGRYLLCNGNYAGYYNTPRGVPVQIIFTINEVNPNVNSWSYLKVTLSDYGVEIYDLPITWQ